MTTASIKNFGAVKIRKGMQQKDSLSPLLFTTALKMYFLRGIDIFGNKLKKLRFANDIILISNKCCRTFATNGLPTGPFWEE
uniref:Reverse transcriptase domain-containing protein n=1 Tax=Megaselia scalaris TaxID=36166 RepID=T1GCM2_MEGSC